MNKILREEMEYLIKCDDKAITPDVKDDVYLTLQYIDELENKIDKAIEYIEKHKEALHHSFDEPDCDYWIATNPDDLLDILRGENE